LHYIATAVKLHYNVVRGRIATIGIAVQAINNNKQLPRSTAPQWISNREFDNPMARTPVHDRVLQNSFTIRGRPEPIPNFYKMQLTTSLGTLPPWSARLLKILRNRGDLNLSMTSFAILATLIDVSYCKMLIHYNLVEFAEETIIHERTMRRAIQDLRELDLIRMVDYKEKKYIIVDPLLANPGTKQQRTHKIQVWNNAIQYKRIRNTDLGHS
jgi:hypothetical protein